MPTLNGRALSQSRFIVTSTAFPGAYFTEFAGLDYQRQTGTYSDGLEFQRFYTIGTSVLEPMTMTIPLSEEPQTDIISYQKNNPCESFIVAVTPVNCDGEEITVNNATLYFTGCQITRTQAYQVNRNEATVSTIQISFVADNFYFD